MEKKTGQREKLEALFKHRAESLDRLSKCLESGHETVNLIALNKTEEAVKSFEAAAELWMAAADSLHELREIEKDL